MLKQFYEAVLPRSGCYTLFLLGSKQHLWADSVSELADMTEARVDQQGVYYAVESFNEPTARTQANVKALRALRLDIDAGAKKHAADPDNTYATQRDALVAAIAFFKATGIAPSYIVSSGEGLHIYYCLSDDLDPQEWLPIAKRLGQLGAEHGLRIDRSVTSDTARVLRPVGAYHPNGTRVSILKATGAVYAPQVIREKLGVEAELPKRKFDTSINSDVTSTVEGPPKSAFKIAEQCAALREVAAAKGDVPEPQWRAMLGLVKFTVEGRDVAHEWSNGYDGYDADETDKKFDAYQAGPTSCEKFGEFSPAACKDCKYHGKIKSPIKLGYMTPEQVETLPEDKKPAPRAEAPTTGAPWDNQLPAGYSVRNVKDKRGMWGTVEEMRPTESGERVAVKVDVLFSYDVFWIGRWAEAANDNDTAKAIVNRLGSDGRVKSFVMDQTLAADKVGLLKFLAGKGMLFGNDKRAGDVMSSFIRDSLTRIRNISQRPKISDHFGLRILGDGTLVAAQGKHVIYPDGTILEGMVADHLVGDAEAFSLPIPDSTTGEWGKEVWTDIEERAGRYVQFMKHHYGRPGLEPLQLAAMLSLASPLMAFVTGSFHTGSTLPPNGLTVSMYSRGSGRGKSAIMQAIMSAYGNAAALSKDFNETGSTDNARIQKLSSWGTMPISMDEMGSLSPKSTASLISAVANGTGKSKANRSVGQYQSPPFSLICLMAANRAQRDLVNAAGSESPAIQYRMLELNVDDLPEFSKEEREAYAEEWSRVQFECRGALGAVIQRLVCEVGAAKLNNDILACVSRASELVGGKQDARFQYRALGALLYLQMLLTRNGLAMFDLAPMIAEFKKAHEAGLSYIEENVLPTKGTELAQMMVSDLKPMTLITETETHRGYERSKFDVPLNTRVPDRVEARHITSMGWTYVSGNAIRDWCIEHRVGEREMMADLKKEGVLLPPNKARPTIYSAGVDLFKGTREESAGIWRVYKFDVRKLAQITGGDWEIAEGDTNVVPLTRKQEGVAGPAQTLEQEAS